MVYVSTQTLSAAPRGAVMQSQSELAKVQQELASGKLADVGLSLGGQSGQLLDLALESRRLESFTTTNAVASTRLQSTTSALDTMQTAANSFLSALTTADSSSPSITSLPITAASNLNALISGLNTQVGGQFIFGGINSAVSPIAQYDATPPSAAKSAVDSSFTATFGFSPSDPQAASISAADMKNYLDNQFASLFTPSSFGANWSSASDQPMTTEIAANDKVTTSVSANESAFRTLAQAYSMVSAFSGKNLGTAAAQAVTSAAVSLIGQASAALTDLNASAGISLNAISDANERMTTQKNLLDTQVEGLQGADTYSLTTQVSTLQTQIQASYELTSKLQSLSLVNYLG